MGHEWYDSLSVEALFEADFEDMLLAKSSDLYPTFFLVRFKARVSSEFGVGAPDLALIDQEYRGWWIVEVELGSHSLNHHVQRQVEIFSTATYGSNEVAHLLAQKPDLDTVRLKDLMLGAAPRVLVLVNEPKPGWSAPLARWDALIGVVEIFRSETNQLVLRVNGQHPEPAPDIVSLVRTDTLLPSLLIVDSPAGLGIQADETINISYRGGTSTWRRLDSSNRVWLVSTGRSPLRAEDQVLELTRTRDGNLLLRSRSRQGSSR